MADWREKLNPILKEYLDSLIKDTYSEKKAYSKAKNPSNAQLWVALANLSSENQFLLKENKSLKIMVLTLNQKYKFLEKVLREVNPKKLSKDDIDPAKALKDVLKRL